jgi:hypothetical protein
MRALIIDFAIIAPYEAGDRRMAARMAGGWRSWMAAVDGGVSGFGEAAAHENDGGAPAIRGSSDSGGGQSFCLLATF